MQQHNLTDWLPTSVKEAKLRGWDEVDVVIFSGDAYVDHPSFGAAVIGRTLMEVGGYRVVVRASSSGFLPGLWTLWSTTTLQRGGGAAMTPIPPTGGMGCAPTIPR